MAAARETDRPFHIVVTEAGWGEAGVVKSAVGAGAMLLHGIGDTLRVSLTGDPAREVGVAAEILKSLNLRGAAVNVISCPTCGRCRVNLEALARQVSEGAKALERKARRAGSLFAAPPRPISIAVMGCVVNGPGEDSHADIGAACGDGKAVIFQGGRVVKTVAESEVAQELLKGAERLWIWE